MNNREIDILQHTVEFWLKDSNNNEITEPLLEADTDYIEEMIKDGYSQGELNVLIFTENLEDKDPIHCIGWWNIKK